MIEKKTSWFSRLKTGLQRSSSQLTDKISSLLTSRRLDIHTLEDLEDILIEADMGTESAKKLIDSIKKKRFSQDISPQALQEFLADEISLLLNPFSIPLIPDHLKKPWVCLVVGVNGSGKTTTIGKLASQWASEGFHISLIAADTFRAAAVQQLEVWGRRTGVYVKTGVPNADAAGLVFEGIAEATQRKDDIVLIDTAGRLHNKKHLMEELQKIFRVLKKNNPELPHSCILVLDGTTGQNAWAQVQTFQEMIPVSGLIVTKLDGTARGGVVIGLTQKFSLPIHAVGVGESADDLQPFQAQDFARYLMGIEEKI